MAKFLSDNNKNMVVRRLGESSNKQIKFTSDKRKQLQLNYVKLQLRVLRIWP